MKFISLGGAREVGASSYLLKVSDKNILIDCGIRMNCEDKKDSIPSLELIDRLDLILLTHAHMDHSGALPVIHSKFPSVPIYCTGATHRLIELLLNDAVKIMASESIKSEGEIPLYDQSLVEKTLDKIHIIQFSEWISPAGFDNLKIYFHPAGHILGAASILLNTPEGMIMFSGDISVTNQQTINGILFCPFKPDVVVMESTYGDRVHIKKRKEEEKNLAISVGNIISQKGSVIIPAFAVGRAQEVILILKNYQKNNIIPKFPIYIDGMVRSVCDIYESMVFLLSPALQNYIKNSKRPLFFDNEEGFFKVTSQKMRDNLPGDKPCCIISSSGMLTGGPSPIYAKKLAVKDTNAILLTGYQDEESPGRKLLNLNKDDTIEIDGERILVKCQVAQYNLSGHADSNQINQIITYLSPRSIILIHGNSSSVDGLASQLRKFNIWRPSNKEEINPLEMAPLFFYESNSPVPQIIPHSEDSPVINKIPTEPLCKKGEPFMISDIELLWKELQKYPLREYSIPEIVRLWYGEDFKKEERKILEQVLFEDNIYFEKLRAAKKWIYRPRSAEEVKNIQEERIDISGIEKGSVIIFKNENNELRLGFFVAMEESGEYFKSIVKGKKGIRHYPSKHFIQNLGFTVDIENESEPYLKIYLRNLEKESYQYYRTISASEAWKALYGSPQAYPFQDIVKMFFGSDLLPEHKLASAVRINANDIFFRRNRKGEYIPKGIEEVSVKLNKTIERIEKEMEINSLPEGTVLKVKPFDDLSKGPDELAVFTGTVCAKGFDCITSQGKKTLWFSKYIDKTEYSIKLEGKDEKEIIKNLLEF